MMPLLIVWAFVNISAFLLFVHMAETSENYIDPFIYPKLDEWLTKEEVDRFGRIIVKIIFTLFFLPALLVYFSLALILSLLTLMILKIYDFVKKLRKK